jgi:hypothetical protein
MGGALAGDVASRMAIDSVREVMVGNDGIGLRIRTLTRRRLPKARHAASQPGKFISKASKTVVAAAWGRR